MLQLSQASPVTANRACVNPPTLPWAPRTRTSTASTYRSCTVSPSAPAQWLFFSSWACAFSGWSARGSLRTLPRASHAPTGPWLNFHLPGLLHSRSRWWNHQPARFSPSPSQGDGWKTKRRSSEIFCSSPNLKLKSPPRPQRPTPTCCVSSRSNILIQFFLIFLVCPSGKKYSIKKGKLQFEV